MLIMTVVSSSSAYAYKVTLYLANHSNKSIIVEKNDGTRITVPPHGYIHNNKFENDSYVKNYIDGKYVCDWYVSEEFKMKIIGLEYRKTSYGEWECNEAFLQSMNQNR